jgi:hypothetical protein
VSLPKACCGLLFWGRVAVAVVVAVVVVVVAITVVVVVVVAVVVVVVVAVEECWILRPGYSEVGAWFYFHVLKVEP